VADISCDVAIIGAGTAGLSAERSARRTGARTLLIDEHFSGTTCATVGCMPSKLLIAAGRSAHAVVSAETFGIRVGAVSIDGKAVMRRVRKMRDEFVNATVKSIGELPPDRRLEGVARFVAPDLLKVGEQHIRASAVVIATGSSPAIPDQFHGLDNVMTNDTIFEMDDLPRSLAVVGAGPLGLELAQAFARLGVHVEVFDEGDTLAALKNEQVAAVFRTVLEKELPIHLNTSLEAQAAADGTEISWSGASQGRRIFSHVLIAAGRPPRLSTLTLEHAGIELDKHGTPIFDRNTLQCGSAPIFLAGDCNADVPVLHEASAEGAIAGRNAACYPRVEPSDRSTPFAITFTDPPVASVGPLPDRETILGESDYSDQGRAKVDGRNSGIVHIYADRDGVLTGATLAAPEAEHMAHLIAWAVGHRLTAMQLLELPIYHPTYEEGLRTALRQICDKARLRLSADRDGGTAPGF
jgi:dihydrolipoamide dehydrogenase